MKNLIFSLFVISIISCNNGSRKRENNLEKQEQYIKNGDGTNKNILKYTHEIIPGKRLGAIVLNENITVAFDSLGKPDVVDAAMGKAVSSWQKYDDKPLTIYSTMLMGVENFRRIKVIRSLSEKYKTEENLGVKSSLTDLKKHYDLNSIGTFTYRGEDFTLYSSPKGIAFEVGSDEKCNGVLIHTSDIDPKSSYLTLYPTFKIQ